MQAARIDEVMDAVEDIAPKLYGALFETNEEKKNQSLEKFNKVKKKKKLHKKFTKKKKGIASSMVWIHRKENWIQWIFFWRLFDHC